MESNSGEIKLKVEQDVNCIAVANIECEEVLCGGLSNFYGPYWTGGLIFQRTSRHASTASFKQLRTGITSVAWFREQDPSVGQHILVSAGDDGAIDLWGVQLMDDFQTQQKNSQDSTSIQNILAQHLVNKIGHGHVISEVSIPEGLGQGQSVISSCFDGWVKLWDSSVGLKCVNSCMIPFTRILAMSSSGNTCVVAGEEKFLRVWDIRQNKWVQKVQTDCPVQCLHIQEQSMVTSDKCGFSHVMDLRKVQKPQISGELHGGYLGTQVQIQSNGKTFASCGEDGRVAVVDQFLTLKQNEISYQLDDIEYFQDEPLWPLESVCWGVSEKGESTNVLFKAGADQTISSHKAILYSNS